ncbi:MAG: hypothetical protein DME26_07885 [Verrucomicrobia bacterium]|nr:MAG: hypothetical protein DME26_07885 [Verrucomicrobiota bacterium]
MRHLLEEFPARGGVGASGINFFNVPGVASGADRRDTLILKSLADGLTRLSGAPFSPVFANSANQNDYRWGRLHRLVLEHTLGGPFNIPPSGGLFPPPLPGLAGIPVDGGYGSVDAAIHPVRADSSDVFMFTRGAATRFVSEAGPGQVRAEASLPGGISGTLGGPQSVNLLAGWLTNDTFPLLFRNSDVQQQAVSVTKFIPVE